jgi:hypothetical protein
MGFFRAIQNSQRSTDGPRSKNIVVAVSAVATCCENPVAGGVVEMDVPLRYRRSPGTQAHAGFSTDPSEINGPTTPERIASRVIPTTNP